MTTPTPTCTIRSVFSTSQNVKVDDYVPEAGNSTNSKFVAILNEGQTFNPEPQYIINLKAQNISFLEKNTGDLNNFNTIFPNGYAIMSTEMKYSKWISYRLTNRYSYSYKLNTSMLLLLSQTLSALPFELTCLICNPDDSTFKTVTLPTLSVGTAYIYATINETIPAGKYIQFKIRCPDPPSGQTASSPMPFQTLLNYLVISHTGTKVAVPEMTYDATSITSTYEKVAENSITLSLKPSLKGDNLAGHKVQFYANLNSQRTNLGEETIGEINAGKYSVTRNLANGTLPVGAYTISVELKRPATSPTNYVQNASTTVNALAYIVDKQKIVLTTGIVNPKVSYLGNFIINSSIDHKKSGTVSVKITSGSDYVRNDLMTLLQNGDYSYTKPVKTSPMSMTIGTTYTVETQFIPDSSVASNFEASDVKTVTFTIDPYKMVISVINNLTTIKYRESIEFNAIPKTGNDSAESQVTGNKSIVISKDGVVVEIQSVPYTLTPYQTSLYSPGTYVAVAKFSNTSTVLDSDAYTFTINAQDTTLAVNSPPSRTIYGDANTSDDDIKTVEGVYTYAYNTPFTVSGVLKTGTNQALASQLKIQSGTPARTNILIKDSLNENAVVFDGEYTIDENGAVTSFKSGHGQSGTELLLAINLTNLQSDPDYYYNADNMTVDGVVSDYGIVLSTFPGIDTKLSVSGAPMWTFWINEGVYNTSHKVVETTTTENNLPPIYSLDNFSIGVTESTLVIKDRANNTLITFAYTKDSNNILTSLKEAGNETELLLGVETVGFEIERNSTYYKLLNSNQILSNGETTTNGTSFAFTSASQNLATYFRTGYDTDYSFKNTYCIFHSQSNGGLQLFIFYDQTVTTTSFVDHNFSTSGLVVETQFIDEINGDITNFQLTRDTGSVNVSSHLSNVTMVDGEDNGDPAVLYTLKVSSPADIGAGLDTETPVDFTLKWNPPNTNYLLSTAPIKVKALKDFVELKIEAAQTSVKFEDNIVITCTVSNQEQDMTVPHPDLSGTYKLYRKKLLDATWPTDPILTQVDSLNTKTSVFTVPALELEIGTHMFYVDYVPSTQLSANFYPEIRAPANISIDVQKIDTNFAVKIINDSGDEITSVNVDQKVRFRVTDCKTQFGDGHAVAGTLSLISPVVAGFSTVTFSDNGVTNGDFDAFKIMELLIPKTTTSFVFKFTPTPTRSTHFNAKEITLENITINPAGALPFIGSGTDLANGSPKYLEDIVINLQLTLVSSASGTDVIPLSGKLELIKTDNSVESVIYNNNNENFTITGNNFVINTGKKPYDFGFTYNIPVSLKLRFTPTNDQYKYYSKYEKTVTIVSQKQTLQKINIITTKSTYTYGEKIGLSVNTDDSYPFTGTIHYSLQKVVNGSAFGSVSEIGTSSIVTSSTANEEFVITHLEAGDANNASTPYQVTCKFVSTDVNFTDSVDNITQVVPKPIAHTKSTVKLTNLEFRYKNKSGTNVTTRDLESVYNSNIELLNSSTFTIAGDITNAIDSSNVGLGTVSVINRYTEENGVTVSTTVYKSAPVLGGKFTISYEPTITGEILLIYESTENFLSNTNNLSQSPDFNTFYLILSNIPYEIEMSIGATVDVGIMDYHDGSFTANVNMKMLRSDAAKQASNNQDKFLLTISNTNGDIVYSTKLDLVEEKTNTVGSFTFIPRKLSSTVPRPATTALANGLEAGDYLLKVSYDGIAGFYDAEQANDSLIPANKFIRFTVAKTNPAIQSALTHRFNSNDNTLMAETKLDDDAIGYAMVQATNDTASFFYRELPNMSIRVQTHRTAFATYNADNNLLGKTVVKFHETFEVLSTKGYKIVNISGATGASGVSDNEITNIVNTKIVQLPLLDAGSVTFIELEFTPDDTRNYNSKRVLIRTEVKKYTPILLNAPNTVDYEIKVVDDVPSSLNGNILQSLAYDTNGVINYDENFEVNNKLQRSDLFTDISYDNIDGELIFRYYSTNPTNPTPINDAAIPVTVTNNKRDYKTTFNPKDILSEAERVNVGNHTMIVSFKPSDLANYNESEPISRDFSIYIANDVGIVAIHDPVPTVVFNKELTLTLTATVTFGPDVAPKTGNLSFYWGNQTETYPVFDTEHLLSTSKNTSSTGVITVSGSDDYSLVINTNSNNVMLTPRFAPYVIYAKLTPTSNNYPVIIHSVKKTVQINPSLVITISSTKGKTFASGPNTLSSIEVGDANDDIILTATLVHGNEAYSGGVANFIITKGDDIYVASVPFTNNVAEFRTKTVDEARYIQQNGVNVSQFTMGFGEYAVACDATFGNSNPMYKPISEDYLNGYLILKRTSTYSLSIDKTNIVYGNIRPKVTTTFDEDFVYGGYFTYTIKYTSVNGVTTITQDQNLTNNADKFGSNPPSKTYTLELSSLVDSSNNIIDLTVGSYSITSAYLSEPNFSGTSSNTVYFVVNKKEVIIESLNNYYLSLDSRQFTLSATLANSNITDSSVKFVNTTTNQVYPATHSGDNYSVTVSDSGNDLVAGTYEIMAYFSGNFNYNKSNNVFSNLIVQRQQKAITLSVSQDVDASNKYTLNVNTVTGDTVHVYSTHKKEAIAVLSHTADHPYKIADTLLNVGLNRVFVTVVHPNYSGSSNIVDITRPKMPLTVSTFTSSASSVQYKNTVTLTANVTTGRNYVVTEGETMDFYVNGSHAGTVDVVNNVATLPNVCLREMDANVIVAKFVNSKSYVCENTHLPITVTVTKADMAVTLRDETSSDSNKLNNKTVSLYLGTLTQNNKTDTTDDVVEFSRINSGTATFYNNNDIIYDNVPIINGVASISLSMDLASYSIKATFNGNVNYNSSVFSSILTFTTTQKAVSDYYASVTLAEGSKNDGKTCYIVANVALKSGVASMPASSLLLNTGVVTFTFEGVEKIVNLVDGVATAHFKSSSKDTLPTIVYSNTAYSGTLSPSSVAWPVDYLALDFLNSASRQYVNIFKATQTTFDINKPFRFTQQCILTILVRPGTYIRYIDTSVANPVVTKTTIKTDNEYVIINVNSSSFYLVFSQNTTSINMSYTSLYRYQGAWDFSSEVSLSISNGTIQGRSFVYYESGSLTNVREGYVLYVSS